MPSIFSLNIKREKAEPERKIQIYSLKELGPLEFINRLREELAKESLLNQDEYFFNNYDPQYKFSSTNLFYLLSVGKYDSGDFYMLFQGDSFVGCTGWYKYEKSIIAMSRAYLAHHYRTQSVLSSTILPLIISINKESKWPILMTFNENRKNIYNCFERIHAGKPIVLGIEWPEVFKLFIPKGKKKLFGFNQYVVEYNPGDKG